MADDTENVVHLQPGAAGWVQQGLAAEQRGDACTGGHLQLTQRGADAPLLGGQAIDEHFPLAGSVNLQPGAGDRQWRGRHLDLGLLRRPGQRGALKQQRNQHDEERHVEEQLSVFQPGHQRKDREDHRHCAAQADPGNEQALAQVEAAKRCQADEHGQWAGKQDHPQRQAQCRQGDGQQLAGCE